MSISLKVVREAAVSWDCFSLSAVLSLMRVILTRLSPPSLFSVTERTVGPSAFFSALGASTLGASALGASAFLGASALGASAFLGASALGASALPSTFQQKKKKKQRNLIYNRHVLERGGGG